MTDLMPSTPELRPYTDSIVDLSESALVPLESSAPELTPYEELSAEPTVKRLPDFSLLDDLPTAPRRERRCDTVLPPASGVPLPTPQPLPPVKSLPPVGMLPARKKPESLPPIAPLPQKKPRSAPLPAAALPKKKPRSLPPIAPLPARRKAVREPSIPRELPRAQATLEWAIGATDTSPQYPEDNERTSVMPVSSAVDRKPRTRLLGTWLPVALGALLGLSVFVATFMALRPSPAAELQKGESLLVTVAGPGGGLVESPRVFIDGVRRCESSPCMVPELAEGLHFVTVAAREHVTTSPRVVRVGDGQPALLHVDLVKEEVAAPEPSTTPLESLPLESRAPAPVTQSIEPGPPPAEATPPAPAPAPRAPAPPPEAGAFLSLSSIPAAAVLVDGRPLGMTPKFNVAVKPGAHVVVFVHPEHGRRARAVMVDAGARQTVAMRFESGE